MKQTKPKIIYRLVKQINLCKEIKENALDTKKIKKFIDVRS